MMRRGGVERALISAWYGPGGDLISNEEVLALVRSYPELVSYMRAHGKNKVLFGTNYPMISPEVCLEKLPEQSLDGEQAGLFLYQNRVCLGWHGVVLLGICSEIPAVQLLEQ